MRNLLVFLSVIFLTILSLGASDMNEKQTVQMTIVYDNYPFDQRLELDWGFSCLIQGLEKVILFDTGTNGKILLSNMEKLGILPDEVDLVILSHFHKDHTGGLDAFLEKNSAVEVWMPDFFPPDFKDGVRKKGAKVVEVSAFQNICNRAYTTGVVQGWIKEQSLVVETDKGLIVITGCAHPRIVKIITTAKEKLQKNIHLAFGGFHMAGFNKSEIREVIDKFRELGVEKVGPSHCSGDETRKYFAEEYKEDFIKLGAGAKIKVQ